MKRIATLIIGTLTLFGMLPNNPAEAGGGDYQTRECINYSGGYTTCLRVGWSRQSDGEGVRLEQMYVTTPNQCWLMEPLAYTDTQAWWMNPTGAIDYYYDFGNEWNCDYVKDVSNNGKEKGVMELKYTTNAHVVTRTGFDHLVWKVQLQPDGGKDWQLSYHED